ncbi:hypothetical protein KCP70_17795 [Salmonella enterica subsp. enterica]|nr:hypothetical protein KCP70_17795 [Salmonella enterica subsp. enterica]
MLLTPCWNVPQRTDFQYRSTDEPCRGQRWSAGLPGRTESRHGRIRHGEGFVRFTAGLDSLYYSRSP